MKISLYNTKTRSKEDFVPIDPKDIRMYVCGPTVYDRAHLGNARPAVVFDVLFRLLQHVYGNEHTTYVRNFTDVDDKINAKAVATGRNIRDITNETIDWYHEDMDALKVLRPTHEPRATEHVADMQEMIEILIQKNHAYMIDGSVFFDTNSYPQYGAFSGNRATESPINRIAENTAKKNPQDFILWKPAKAEEQGWDSPWGYGRMGWHIECSAMSIALLGKKFDIHGGGLDLRFPHHENEIAQSCCYTGEADTANYWLHNEMVRIDGTKMSKSSGSFKTVRQIMDSGISGTAIRLCLLSTPYGKPLNLDMGKWKQYDKTVTKWNAAAGALVLGKHHLPIEKHLSNNLNVAGAISELHSMTKQSKDGDGTAAMELAASLELLGLRR